MIFKTKALLAAMDKVLDVIDTSGTHLSSPAQNFHFNNESLQAHTRIMRARTRLPGSDLACGVEAKPFRDLIGSVTEDEVELTVKKHVLHVRTVTLSAKIVCGDKNISKVFDFSESPAANCEDAGVICSLLDGLQWYEYAVLPGLSGVVGGLHIAEDTMTCTDRRRIMMYKLQGSIKGMTCTLTPLLIKILRKNIITISRIAYTKQCVVEVQLDADTYLEANTLQGDYPKLVQYIPIDDTKAVPVVFNNKEMLTALKRHTTFLKMVSVNDKEIKLILDANKCIVQSTTSNTGQLEDTVTLSVPVAAPATITVHPAFFKDVLKLCGDEGFQYYADSNLLLVKNNQLVYALQIKV